MQFTYEAYEKLILLLKENDYIFSDYGNWNNYDKTVIMRHDIDFSLEYAEKMSYIEKKSGIHGIYFLMLNTDFYNVASAHSIGLIKNIISNGGIIGLHFDEYGIDSNSVDIVDEIKREKTILSDIVGSDISFVSMHRPSDKTLQANYELEDGMINVYSDLFFNKFKYVSDSRMCWHENVEDIIRSGNYDKLQILIHPFWYRDEVHSARDCLLSFIDERRYITYECLNENIRDLRDFINEKDFI